MIDAMLLSLTFLEGVFTTITTADSPFMFVFGMGMLVAIISIFMSLTTVGRGKRRL
ncbi:hypothetical protein CLHUN_35860 [Ruminiclostridium hungatei]|uniref:Uncharacterized protein n=1 Tax=Ruminiclostridium hungatei TaxID=48256 RepID=A0A1V4SGT8_RUMHU|nr:hypothetical protein [Ruminiclostridium hungatei]OPX42450.1 hypothetical protein CLHUN_35750 [Ruminiclostridium hungatei]OPX42461.1 hypothetical protein CLHUN_35860 [Ruminiclostridium hungatei]